MLMYSTKCVTANAGNVVKAMSTYSAVMTVHMSGLPVYVLIFSKLTNTRLVNGMYR